jgi:glutathione reductase (NADPH)
MMFIAALFLMIELLTGGWFGLPYSDKRCHHKHSTAFAPPPQFFRRLFRMHNFDLFVIGAGSGGVRAARTAAALGARVGIAEDKALGGTCVNVGCIPKKLYSMASHYRSDFEDAAGFGWQLDAPRFDWATLRTNKQHEITRLNGIYQNLLLKAGVQLLPARATLIDANTVSVGGQHYSARYILLCTGGRPQLADFAGNELALSSDQIFDLPSFPRRILIQGAGYIGVEFAGIFAGLGAETWLSWRGELPLRGFDEDLRRRFMAEAGKHCHLLPGTQIAALEQLPDGQLNATLRGGTTELAVDQVLVATGRVANVTGLGLENTKVRLTTTGHVEVDAEFQTAEPSIFALGDVVGRMALTPVALAEAMLVVNRLFGDRSRQFGYTNIPTAVFSHPNLATVGISEAAARTQGFGVAIYETDFRHLRHTLSGRDERTYMKVIVDVATDKVLGIHMLGNDAGEIVQGFAVAMTCGLTKAQMDATVGIHPTAAEELVTLRTRSR